MASDRAMTVAAETAITASHVWWCALVELDFPSGFLRFTNAGHSMVWDGVEWLGAGNLAQVEPISEVASPQAAALNIKFSGLNPAHVAAVRDDAYQGRPARIWIATLDEHLRVVADPILVFVGKCDEPVIDIGETVSIQLALENRFADWDRPRVRIYSDADQQSRHPGDKFFEYVAAMESTSIQWGTYRGPVAPDPLKVFNRTLDKATRYNFFNTMAPGFARPALNAARKIGDAVGKIFGW